MSRANNNGWDFVKVGGSYQYKEGGFIAMVTVVEDNSDDDYYRFTLRVDKATFTPPDNGEFEISHIKNLDGVYSGRSQLYEDEAYFCNYKWIKGEIKTEK